MAEKYIEKLGWKAYKKGFFEQWQAEASQLIVENPTSPKADMYEQAYKNLKKK
jgi:hypothetical protein